MKYFFAILKKKKKKKKKDVHQQKSTQKIDKFTQRQINNARN